MLGAAREGVKRHKYQAVAQMKRVEAGFFHGGIANSLLTNPPTLYWADAAIARPAISMLRPTPGRPRVPPQNRKYRQERPPERVGRLVRNNGKYDADDDAHQRHDISNAQEHHSPLAYQSRGYSTSPDVAPRLQAW
jgi:hypothetical protein